MVRTFLLSLLLLLASITICNAAEQAEVSGTISTGYRILEVDPKSQDNHLRVYRGDYIKLAFAETFGALPFAIPELKYTATLSADPAGSPFFKMKAVGDYPFTLGTGGGRITVIDLVRPNYTEVTADEAALLLENLDPFILDVRTPGEYNQIHIKGSELIPIGQLQARVGELESKKHEDIFIYCATGNRSTVASKILADLGFKRIYNLRYGVMDWARRGHPYVTGR